MKRSLYIFNEVSPAGNYGIGTYVSQVQECFSCDETISVYVVQLCSKEDEYRFDDKTNTHHIPMGRRYSYNKRAQYIKGVIRLLKLKIEQADEIIFLFNFSTHLEFIDFVKSHFLSSKIIFTIHYLGWTFLVKGNNRAFVNALTQLSHEQKTPLETQICDTVLQDKEVLGKVDHIICLAKYTKNVLTNSYGINEEKITDIYNGLKDDARNSKITKYELRKSLGISLKEKVILYVGRIDRDKGGCELIKAFRLILDTNPNCRLIIVGNGDIDLLQNESRDIWAKITYTGKIDKIQVYKFYQLADVGILPSFSEQCSYVAIEMMMFGLPIVGTNSTGLSEMIVEDITGYKVELEETETDVILSEKVLAEKTIKLLSSPRIREIRKNSRQRFLDNYSIEKMQEKIMKAIYGE